MVRLLAAAAALGLLAGCGPDDVGGDGPEWPASSDPVDTTGLIWATGSTVHLSDGTTIDTGRTLGPYVVAGDGVFFTTDAEATGTPAESGPTPSPLYFADRAGAVTDTGVDAYTLSASPDGRYLGLLDLTSGEQDEFGTRQAETVVVDLRTGEEVVRSTAGMGDPDADDLASLYSEAVLGVSRVTDDSAYVEAVGATYAFDLATGEGEPAPDDLDLSYPPFDDRTSPDGAWRILDDESWQDQLVSADGERATPDSGTARRDLVWWVDDLTVAGFAISGPGTGSQLAADDRGTLMTCVVPSGACEVVEETAGTTVRFPTGTTDYATVTLPGG